jgi:uncharacterized protein (TIGR02646 family)
MRPVNKDLEPLHADGTVVTFPEYARSRRYLINAIGEYCSYCERLIPASLAVEHIQPKTHNGHLELVWSNLLLACTNCNSTKGHTNVVLADYFWPDRDNTYEKFTYDLSGFVKPNPTLNAVEALKSNNTIGLLGLDRIQPTSGTANWEQASDRRYEHRLQAFVEANNYATIYRGATLIERNVFIVFLIDIAKKSFWSIWMRAFEDFPEVQRALINNFTGTRHAYFQNILNIP